MMLAMLGRDVCLRTSLLVVDFLGFNVRHVVAKNGADGLVVVNSEVLDAVLQRHP